MQHVVLIPDGNRRWAKKKARPAMLGHQAGAKTATKILDASLKLDIPYITLWAASVSNLIKRNPLEIAFLNKIFSEYFKKITKERKIHKNEVRVEVIGRWRELCPPATRKAIEAAIKATEKYKKRQLTILIGYSGIEEMTAATEKIAQAARKDEKMLITSETIASHLWTKNLPPVDLVIRTGGEPHWSEGMLMWHVANAQLHFTPTLWPDFTPEEFEKILEKNLKIERRLGA